MNLFRTIILGIVAITVSNAENLPSFPGAEGFGKFTIGGRGDRFIMLLILMIPVLAPFAMR